MPGGRARGNPVQIFSEIDQKISPDRFEKYFQDLHNIGPYIEIYYWFDLALNGKDFGVCGAQWIGLVIAAGNGNCEAVSYKTFM